MEKIELLNTREVPKISQISVYKSFRERTLAPVMIQTWSSGGKRDIFRVDAVFFRISALAG
jgi:hypothetical protein